MAGLSAEALLEAVARQEGEEAARAMAKRLKAEAGVDISFTVVPKVRKRKHRWGTAVGHVVAVRLDDSVYGRIRALASRRGLSVGGYVKWLIDTQAMRKR